MSRALVILLLASIGCGPATEAVAPTTVHIAEPPNEPGRTTEPAAPAHPLNHWANGVADQVLAILDGGAPPLGLPITPIDHRSELVRNPNGIDLAGARVGFIFIGAMVVLTNGLESIVEVTITAEGPRIVTIRAFGRRSQTESRQLGEYFAPLDHYAQEVANDIRGGHGMEHVLTAAQLRRTLPTPEMAESAVDELISAEEMAEVQTELNEPGGDVASVTPRTIGIFLETAAGVFVGANLRTTTTDDRVRFRTEPLIRIRPAGER